jgi:hypothetical protein
MRYYNFDFFATATQAMTTFSDGKKSIEYQLVYILRYLVQNWIDWRSSHPFNSTKGLSSGKRH